MKVSKSTFYRDIDELLQLGIVIKKEEGYSISTELFLVFDSKDNLLEYKAILDEAALQDKQFKESREYTTFYKYYNKDIKGLRMPLRDFYFQLSSGFFFKNKPDTDSNKKEQVKQTYSF